MDEATKLKIELLQMRIMLNESNAMVMVYQNRDMTAQIAVLQAAAKPADPGVE